MTTPPLSAGAGVDRQCRFIGGFESTFLPGHGVDSFQTTGHDRRRTADLEALRASGVTWLRYPVRWHRIEAAAGAYDWRETDRSLGWLRDAGMEPIVDLVHHTSYPSWLDGGFGDPRFPGAYLRFAEAVAGRYPWLPAYTLFNEPFVTMFLAGHQAIWPPYRHGLKGFVALLANVLPALVEAAQGWRAALPGARHLWVESCEHHGAAPGSAAADHAALANDRRFVILDLALGHDLDPSDRPFVRRLLEAGGERLLGLGPVQVDQLGLDYYPQSEWWYDGGGSRAPSPHPVGLAALAAQYGERYRLPMVLAETNIRGFPSDRASWLRYTLEQYELAVASGVPLEGYCWFPTVDSCDWDSLLARPARRIDPVGVWALEPDGTTRRTSMTLAWEAAAAGAPVSLLPAYRFQQPVASRLAGFLPQMSHWPWTDPPPRERVPPVDLQPAAMCLSIRTPTARSA